MFVAVILSSISCNDSVDKNIEIIPLEGWTREDTNYYKGKTIIRVKCLSTEVNST